MTELPSEPAGLDVHQYAEIQTRLRQLKSQLPKESVENLAREVIRLLAGDTTEDDLQAPTRERIAELCHALMSSDDQAGARMIQAVRSEGATIEAVYLNYLAGAARMLGTWWEESRATFVEVTVATSRMYAIMRTLSRQLPLVVPGQQKTAVFAAVPGETHILGIRMATDLFRKEGWDIDLKIGKTHDELLSELSLPDVAVIGLSASGEHTLEALSKLVIALRIKNPKAAIYVSGHVVEEHMDVVDLMDVDGTAIDYETAKSILETHIMRS